MATPSVLQEIEAGALAELVTLYNANQTTVEAWIGSGEANITTQLAALIKQIPTVKGALGLIAGPLEAAGETAILNYAASLVAKYPPATIYALIGSALANLEKNA